MYKKEVLVDGITYTISATTEAGIETAIRDLKRAVKQNKKPKTKDGE